MDNQELARILDSNLDTEVIHSIEENESEIEKLEQLVRHKNNQVFELHSLINHQMQSIINQNQKLKAANTLYKKFVSHTKNSLQDLKNSVKMEMKKSFHFYLSLLQYQNIRECNRSEQQKCCGDYTKNKQVSTSCLGVQAKEVLKDYYCQTSLVQKAEMDCQTCNDNSLNAHLLVRIESLEASILKLKEEKWQLEKQIQKPESLAPFEEEYSSKQSLSEQDIKKMLTTHIKEGFKCLKEIKFCGEFINNVKNGEGICEYENMFVYEGGFLNGKRHGLGEIRFKQEILYRGEWKDDAPEGKGILFFFNDVTDRFCGTFKNGVIEGYGTLIYLDGRRIMGQFEEWKVCGASIVEEEEDINYFPSLSNIQQISVI